jgi:hypothetical protein
MPVKYLNEPVRNGTYSYTTIVGVPSEAIEYQTIDFRVRIFNESELEGFYAFPYVIIGGQGQDGTVEWIGAYPAYHEWDFSFIMPAHDVTVEAQGLISFDSSEWILDYVAIPQTVYLQGEEPPPEETKAFPWGWVALGAATGLLIFAASRRAKRK